MIYHPKTILIDNSYSLFTNYFLKSSLAFWLIYNLWYDRWVSRPNLHSIKCDKVLILTHHPLLLTFFCYWSPWVKVKPRDDDSHHHILIILSITHHYEWFNLRTNLWGIFVMAHRDTINKMFKIYSTLPFWKRCHVLYKVFGDLVGKGFRKTLRQEF